MTSPKRSRTNVSLNASTDSPTGIMTLSVMMAANTRTRTARVCVNPLLCSVPNRSATSTTQAMTATNISGNASCSSESIISCSSWVDLGVRDVVNQVGHGRFHHLDQRIRPQAEAKHEKCQHDHHGPFPAVKVRKRGHVVVGHFAVEHPLDQP